MKGSINVRVALDEESGSESDYDFVNTPPSSPTSTSVSTSPIPSKGWSTLEMPGSVAKGSSGRAVLTPTATCDMPTATSEKRGGPLFNCAVCGLLLRDCVECPRCHSLFCRSHLDIDEDGESPCPCEPCVVSSATKNNKSGNIKGSNKIAADGFLPNIPVQRMADAVPSSCEGCGICLPWGELSAHICDLQIVNCEDAQWGCTWTGRRVHRSEHMVSSTCPGRIARVENELAEARAQLSKARGDVLEARKESEASERRVQAVEALNEELKELAARRLREKEAASAAAAEVSVALAKATSAAQGMGRAKTGGGSDGNSGGRSGGDSGGGVSVPASTTATSGQATQSSAHAQTSGEEDAARAALPDPFKPNSGQRRYQLYHLQQLRQQQQRQQQQRSGGAAPSTSSSVGSTRDRAVAEKLGSVGVVEAACQAPVPATEACLKPYLERPESLLEKKVVVFWPRQGRWYIGRPTSYKSSTKEHRVEYDDGDVRDHVLAHRSWGLIG